MAFSSRGSSAATGVWRYLFTIIVLVSIVGGVQSFAIIHSQRRGRAMLSNKKADIDSRRRIVAASLMEQERREPLTRLHLQFSLGFDDDNEENSDFYNPEGIKEGDQVEIIKDTTFYSIPKSPKEGVKTKGFKGEVFQLKFTAKNGVVCSINRPVVVKFTEPYKFQGHFEFKEVKKL